MCTSSQDTMTLAQKFRSLSVMGGSSKLDEIFLPVNTECTSREGELETVETMVTGGDVGIQSMQANFLDNLVTGATGNSSTGKCYQASIASFVMIAMIIVTIVVGHQYIKDFLTWLEQVDFVISYAIFLVLYVIVSFPVAWGYMLLMVTAGYLYSFLYGPLVVLSGGLLGVFVSHVTMRHCCRSYFYRKFYNEKVEAVIRVVESDQGFKVIALARLTPIPFGLQNGLFALADVPVWKYCLASVLGLIPMAVLNCYVGSTLRSMEDVVGGDANKVYGYCLFAGQFAIAAVLIFFVVRKARVELRRTVIDIQRQPEGPTLASMSNFYIDVNDAS